MNTTFVLIATYQVYENYGAHCWNGEGECPQHWKAKGSTEVVVAENLSITATMALGAEKIRDMIDAADANSCDDFFEYSLLDYELVELSQHVLDRVQAYVNSGEMYMPNDYYAFIDVSISLNISEYAAKWAMEKLNLRKIA